MLKQGGGGGGWGCQTGGKLGKVWWPNDKSIELPLIEKGRFQSLGASLCVVPLGSTLYSHIDSFHSGV